VRYNIAMFRVPVQEMLAVLRGRVTFVLPENLVVENVNYSYQCNALEVYVSHPSFPPVPAGCMVPMLMQTVRYDPENKQIVTVELLK